MTLSRRRFNYPTTSSILKFDVTASGRSNETSDWDNDIELRVQQIIRVKIIPPGNNSVVMLWFCKCHRVNLTQRSLDRNSSRVLICDTFTTFFILLIFWIKSTYLFSMFIRAYNPVLFCYMTSHEIFKLKAPKIKNRK